MPSRKGLLVHTMATKEAMVDAEIGPAVVAMILAAYRAARGEGSAASECYLCERTWTLKRVPVAIAYFESVGHRRPCRGLGGLCPSCADSPDLRARLIAAVERDFQISADEVRDVPCVAGRA